MNVYGKTFVFLCIAGGVYEAFAAGFLRAESFPGTFQDLSFESRMAVLADGYDGFETKFENGVCVAGCPYRGITVPEMDALIIQNTAAGNLAAQQLMNSQPVVDIQSNDAVVQTVYNYGTSSQSQDMISDVGTSVAQLPQVQPTWECKYHSEIVKSNNTVPNQAPLDVNLVVTSDYGWRNAPVRGASTMHNGIDLLASSGTPVYVPASGTVIELPGGTCGIGVTVDHGAGWKTKYCHLSQRTVNIGERVQSGCQIGTVGNTGASTGAHLHYAIIYNDKPYDLLYRINHLGRSYQMDTLSVSRPDGVVLPGRI